MASFLDMIAVSEGTARAPNPYAVTFGYKYTITDFADHPYPKYWKGEPLDFLGPTYAGLISTAAGKYQLTKHTWEALQGALGLPDFGKQSQDDGAQLLIKQKGATDLINGGQIVDAIGLLHSLWASLPGSTSGQPQANMANLLKAYSDSGGAYA
jgi:muramidase (phage lysozyme)